MVNVDLVCQSTPKEPLWTRVSRGAVATAITACGFVTCTYLLLESGVYSCNSDYRLRFCNNTQSLQTGYSCCRCNSDYRLRFCNFHLFPCFNLFSQVATAITACGFVTTMTGSDDSDVAMQTVATAITACGFVTLYPCSLPQQSQSCNSDYRLRFCNFVSLLFTSTVSELQQRLPLAVL